ncbi:anaerobic ribonucleoside-triphosphate reductase activating protein [Pseudoduganella flava]|uniref:Anaerobic ribonucleoside-triphosphate reductase activating protein n=1 Tax=Pseudoduganella flava TaxID=871742 RepID=A0A562PBV7_9BURK|nr:anaerobic ribonucleoside-triphosphate reductase activating protein [Pseudoduganella flava]QGZ38001.1 anaerobic ribonucleoside-triphosphate reductase activating protein [Pseudoduganella flava]TWI41823.1 anaerobic ribonucleoside-triphosphate reductase activating protein [Pseudoduganella flava]
MMGRLLNVGGFTPFTATDYPGQLSAVVFVQGCAWRCGYCHNPHLQPRPADSALDWRALLALLERRKGLLDAVVFSGGEPTTDAALPDAMLQVRELGFKVGLHTACIYPDRLQAALPYADWVGFDVKAPFADYEAVTGVPGSGTPARACVAAILASGVDYECRTTVHPALLSPAALLTMADELSALGVRRWVVQQFRPQGCGDGKLRLATGTPYPTDELLAEIRTRFDDVLVRRA